LTRSHYRLAIPSQVDAIRKMSEWLDAAIREMGMTEELVFRFDLCANEAVTNIISYAYPENSLHEITLELSLDGESLSLEIVDDGGPFDPLKHPPHKQPANISEAEIGGLGIDLIRKFMDECRYSRHEGKNSLKMLARLSAS